jgi:hypothetical protein
LPANIKPFIAYVVYSRVLTGAQYMNIAAQLEIHVKPSIMP